MFSWDLRPDYQAGGHPATCPSDFGAGRRFRPYGRLASTSRRFDECFELLGQGSTGDLIERIALSAQLLFEIRDRLAVAGLCNLKRTLQRSDVVHSAIIQAWVGSGR